MHLTSRNVAVFGVVAQQCSALQRSSVLFLSTRATGPKTDSEALGRMGPSSVAHHPGRRAAAHALGGWDDPGRTRVVGTVLGILIAVLN